MRAYNEWTFVFFMKEGPCVRTAEPNRLSKRLVQGARVPAARPPASGRRHLGGELPHPRVPRRGRAGPGPRAAPIDRGLHRPPLAVRAVKSKTHCPRRHHRRRAALHAPGPDPWRRLDACPYRLPGMRDREVFEVDHPDTQALKRRVPARRGATGCDRVHLVPVVFGRDDVAAELASAGFVQRIRTLASGRARRTTSTTVPSTGPSSRPLPLGAGRRCCSPTWMRVCSMAPSPSQAARQRCGPWRRRESP